MMSPPAPGLATASRILTSSYPIITAMLSASCATSVDLSRHHDLSPAELTGSIAVHAVTNPQSDASKGPELTAAFTRHLAAAGFTPVPSSQPAHWHFECAELTIPRPTVIGCLRMGSLTGRPRWMGSCSETGRGRSDRRISMLMAGFPGRNANSTRIAVHLTPTSEDLGEFVGSLGSVLGAAAGNH